MPTLMVGDQALGSAALRAADLVVAAAAATVLYQHYSLYIYV